MPMSPEIAAAIAGLRSLHIPTERDAALNEQLARLLQADASGGQLPMPVRFTCDLETRGITVIEAAGGGKTTAVRKVLSRSAALNPPGGAPRFLAVKVPSPATLKSLGLEILSKTRFDEISDRAKVWQIWHAVRHRLSHLGIVVLWIDEAQDLFLCRSAREIDDMLKMLKSLMQGDTAVILILSGTERLSEITSYDPQVNRRFTKVVPRDLAIGADEARLSKLVREYASRAEDAVRCDGTVVWGRRGGEVTDRRI
ncbi:MAG: ATP-binding protein [Amaricoccus sp.]|uniref:ATP-binding protein n=1 Tax=Amaricoccus sp. TaxID=1872485 RepID=UPI0033152E6C